MLILQWVVVHLLLFQALFLPVAQLVDPLVGSPHSFPLEVPLLVQHLVVLLVVSQPIFPPAVLALAVLLQEPSYLLEAELLLAVSGVSALHLVAAALELEELGEPLLSVPIQWGDFSQALETSLAGGPHLQDKIN